MAPAFADQLVAAGARVRAALPALELDDAELEAAIIEHGGEDAEAFLASCHLVDLALARSAALGHVFAIAELERAHRALLDSVCRRFAGPGHTHEDLMQILRSKLFVADLERRPRIAEYDGRGSLAGWLRVLAVRELIDLTRRKDRTRELAMTDTTPELIEPQDLALEAIKAEYRGAVAQALVDAARRLEPGDRHLLRQHLAAGLTIDQLAAVLGIHRATAARRITRAREQLATVARALVAERLGLGEAELGEIFSLVASKLELTIKRMLESRPA
ncbi:MAG TPA: sigma-70 family RNA polymerase sigma factor [Kofleriaceae bacterium]